MPLPQAAAQERNRSTNTVNRLNQYTSRTVPPYLAVSGEAATNATVTLWWGTNEWAPVVRQGRYWYGEAQVNNRTGGVWVVVTNLGVVRGSPDRVQSEVRSDFVAQTPETLMYDGDGNLVRDGRWVYSWDAENRLVRVMSYGASDRAGWRRVDWAYDALGRRTRQTSYVLSNGVWVVTEDLKFVSDPVWFGRHIAELNATNHAVVRSYVWGLDLSETLDGAGGVGGLLWVKQHTGPSVGAHFCAYDGNGNIAALIAAADGSETARYEYGPFGEPIRVTGPMAKENPFRFSTKRTDDTTDLVLYEYRVYSPSTGRWPNRDPLGELGFTVLSGGTPIPMGAEFGNKENDVRVSEREANLYAFVGNDVISFLDILGLVDFRFEPVVGELGGMIVGAGSWGQPWNYADGSASSGSKSAHTFIKVWSGPTSAGSCNTVYFKGKFGDNAGAITVFAKDQCPGRYRIWFDVTYEIKTTGPHGNALITVADSNGAVSIRESVAGVTTTIKKNKLVSTIVTFTSKQEVQVLRYDPTISFPPEPKKRNSTGSVDFKIEVVRVKKLD